MQVIIASLLHLLEPQLQVFQLQPATGVSFRLVQSKAKMQLLCKLWGSAA